jgi:hypothetical protein
MTKGMYAVHPLLYAEGGPSKWDWSKVERVLLETHFDDSLWKTV